MKPSRPTSVSSRRDSLILAGLAVGAFLLLMIPNFNRAYGYFIDELYYIACARRLAFGYVDHPPLAPLLLAASNWLLGTSVPAIRFLPALATSATVFMTGLLARSLGGRRFAQILAALAVVSSPVILVMGGIFTVNAFEILFWVAATYVVVRILQTGNARLWLVFGLVAGLGLQNKHTMVLIGAALVVGLLLVPARRMILTKWFWLGGLIAFLILLPNLVWEFRHAWLSLEFYRNAELYKNVPTPPLGVLASQVLFNNPLALPVWLAGVYFFFFTERGRAYRLVGWAYLALLGLMLLAGSSRPDRIGGIYPILFAGGAVWWESLSERRNRGWLKPLLAVLVVSGGALIAPLCLPILSPEATARYTARAGLVPQVERGKTSPLPQWLADRFDWKNLLETVSGVYHSLPPEEQRQAIIAAPSYGHAGAIELFADVYGLPHVISTHNTYFLWGQGEPTPQVLIAIGSNPDELRELFEEVTYAGSLKGTYSMNWRRNMKIYIARKPKVRLEDVWARFKNFG
jgi:hypothetical protein